MPRGLISFDRKWLGNAPRLIGVDEAGRGALAGPVVACAVECSADFYTSSWTRRHARAVNDSKQLTAVQRAAIVQRFQVAVQRGWLRISLGSASVDEIEEYNILGATQRAMARALAPLLDTGGLGPLWQPEVHEPEPPLIIDGRPLRGFSYTHNGIVGGDGKSLAIALAGIHAKQARDAAMEELDAEWPGYDFATHKGYGTAGHMDALRERGPSPLHRPLFLRNFNSRLRDEITLQISPLFPQFSDHDTPRT